MTQEQYFKQVDKEATKIGVIRHMMIQNDFTKEEAEALFEVFVQRKYVRMTNLGWQYVGSMADKEQQELILDMIKNPSPKGV